MLEIDVFTLFPHWFAWLSEETAVQRALSGPLSLRFLSYRDYSPLPHAQVDDAPFGGGAGMLHARRRRRERRRGRLRRRSRRACAPGGASSRSIPGGRRFDDAYARELAAERAHHAPVRPLRGLRRARARARRHRVAEPRPVRAERRRAGRDGGRGRARAAAAGLARRRPLERGGVVRAGARGRARVPALHAPGGVARARACPRCCSRATTRASTPGAASRPPRGAPTRAGADADGSR